MYTIVNLYVPNSRQLSFLHKIRRKVDRIKKGHIIWCGDFNAIVDPTIDTTSTSSTPPVNIHSWLSSSNLYDVWRCQHVAERDYTFYSHPHRIFNHIDLFLVDKQLLSLIKDCSIGTVTWSDHAPIMMSLLPAQSRPAPFSWRNNTYVLSNPKHQTFVEDKLKEYFSLNSSFLGFKFHPIECP